MMIFLSHRENPKRPSVRFLPTVLQCSFDVGVAARRAAAVVLAVASCCAISLTARADIFRWDDGEVIPGTEGITPGPGVQLNDREDLTFADLADFDLTDGNFQLSNLADALFDRSELTDANFTGADLNNASFIDAILMGANFTNADLTSADFFATPVAGVNFTGATINGADFTHAGPGSLTKEQLYTTASYQQMNLREVILFGNDLTDADLSGQDLTDADLTGADLVGASLADAIIVGASFQNAVDFGFTKEQLYSTASYQQMNLRNVSLSDNDLGGWDFSDQNLSGAVLDRSDLDGADFSGAVVSQASFRGSTLMAPQLYSTASYQQKNLQGIRLSSLSLVGWNFSGQDLRRAQIVGADLENTDFSLADLRGMAGFEPEASTIVRNTIDPDSILIDLNLLADETLVANQGGFLGLPVAFFGTFAIAPTAKLDLTDNSAIVYQATATTVRDQLIAGRGGPGLEGAWNGNGIASSTAAAVNQTDPGSRSIGYALNGSLPLGPYDEFHGFPVDASSVLLAYTRTGDANLDGVVNDDDVTIVSATYAPGVPQPHWALGDFDYNGFVDDDDVTLLGVFYDPSAVPAASPAAMANNSITAVPEPTSLVFIGWASAVMLFVVGRRFSCDGRLQ